MHFGCIRLFVPPSMGLDKRFADAVVHWQIERHVRTTSCSQCIHDMSTYVTYCRRRVLNTTAAGIRGKHGTSCSSPSSPRAESGPNNGAAYDAAQSFFYIPMYFLMDSGKPFYYGSIRYTIQPMPPQLILLNVSSSLSCQL